MYTIPGTFLSCTIGRANCVNIIYFDGQLKIRNFFPADCKDDIKVYKLIGELQASNIPYTMLINRKCSVDTNEDYIAITGASSVTDDILRSFFPKAGKLGNKDKRFNEIFKTYITFDTGGQISFAAMFNYFLNHVVRNKLLTAASVFIVIAPDGQIYNGNPNAGKFHDNGKLWYFDEKYESNVITLDPVKPKVDKIADFCSKYENGVYMNFQRIIGYSKTELTEIIKKYPRFLGDLMIKGGSHFDEYAQKYVHEHLEEFLVDSEEVDTDDIPKDMVECCVCDQFVHEDDAEPIEVSNGDNLSMCYACSDKLQRS